jgi:small-conductance mechanosensitive channel
MQETSQKPYGRRGLIQRISLVACALVFAAPGIAAAPQDPGEPVLQYLNDTIEWYRRVAAIDQSTVNTDEILFRDTIRQNSAQALRLGFAYARGKAALLEREAAAASQPSDSASTRSKNLAQATATAAQHVRELQAEIDLVNRQISSATQPASESLTAKHDKLVAALNLAKERQEVLQNFSGFASGNGGPAGLSQKIDELERSTPEAQEDKSAASSAKPNPSSAASSQQVRPESLGLLGLITEMFSLSGKASELKAVAGHTASLHKECDDRRAPLRTELMDAIHRGDVLSKSSDTDDPKTLNEQRQQLDALALRFKGVTGAAVPLGEQNILFESVQGNLTEWRNAVQRDYHRVIRVLLIRLVAVGIAILVVLGISTLWRRATFRYVTDARRRRQFLVIRRLVVGGIITVIVIAAVVTEFSSLVTFAGLITAGVAVALQTVILSGVAHFFFMGRYGVRVGDRVTISGITGDVIDIGIFRLYLMELAGTGRDLNPSGRIVVFSNAVLFQPSAFFKQLPGLDYNWHEVALTLAPDTDHQLAESKLLAAVDSVYAEYRDNVQRQYESIKNVVHFPMPEPKPTGRLRFVDAGLEFVVHYPVEIRRSVEIDDRITRKLLETIEKEPKLRLVASGTPRIQPAGQPA